MKKIGILGTGVVGATIGSKLTSLGFDVKMGSRTATNEKATVWTSQAGEHASHGTFSDAARFGEIVFLCTKGEVTLDALLLAGPENLKRKIIIDISNPLDFSHGMPPSLLPTMVNTNSLGEEVQRAVPESHVVKTLNIVNCEVMVNPKKAGGDITMFLCGNHEPSKAEVKNILQQFGWNDIIDLGDIAAARAMEMVLPLWPRTWMATQNGYFGFKIVR